MTTIADFYPSKYLSADDLAGKDHTLTISRVDSDDFTDNLGHEVRKPVLYFEGAQKGFVLNKTNAQQIAQSVGTNTLEEWIGKKITIGSTWVDAFGKQTLAIRVRPTLIGGALKGAPIETGLGNGQAIDTRPDVPATGPQDDDDLSDSIPF